MPQVVRLNGQPIEVEAKTIRLRKGDWAKLDSIYPNGGARVAIRTMVAVHVDALMKAAAAKLGRDVSEIHDCIPERPMELDSSDIEGDL